jgi:hypothetical protein
MSIDLREQLAVASDRPVAIRTAISISSFSFACVA